ncbi:MAG: MFS transporter [Gammaproteobacteria bacterium]|nr:MFS transporter [Gammaproteobacteria bacterium]
MSSAKTTPTSPARLLCTVGLFGFASGLPLALTGSTLQAWLTEGGLRIETIGALSLVGFPYLFKFLWAPLLDRFPLLRGSRRRGWVLLTQGLLIALFSLLALSDPQSDLSRIVVIVVILAIVSATQDIAVDAYRAEALTHDQRGLGAGVSVAGYRMAMIVSGAGALLIADRFGFSVSFWCLAGCLAGLMLMSVWAPEASLQISAPQSLEDAFASQLLALWATPGIVGFLALVVLYKLGDAFAGNLSMAFFIRGQGFSLTEIGAIYKALGLVATIVGGILGGYWMMRLGLYRALLWFGLLQALTNIGFLLLAATGKSLAGMMVVVTLENLTGGMGTSALLALMMGLCQLRYTATHFALLSALSSVSRVLIGPAAGQVAAIGWVPFFAISLVLAVPALLLLTTLRARIIEVGK